MQDDQAQTTELPENSLPTEAEVATAAEEATVEPSQAAEEQTVPAAEQPSASQQPEGQSVAAAEQPEDQPTTTAELPQREPRPTVAQTEHIPTPTAPPPTVSQDASLRDVAQAAGSYARGLTGRVGAFLRTHLIALGAVAVLGVIAVLGMTFALQGLADMPDPASFRRDAQAMLQAPAYSGGNYGREDQLVLSDLEVTNKHKDPSKPSECQVEVVAHFGNDSVEALQPAVLTYLRQDGAWRCTGAQPEGGASYRALTGVDQARLLANVSSVLQRAETSLQGEERGIGLPTLYAGAEATVVQEAFDEDAQTDTVTLHLMRAATFTAYECDVQASFAFRPGNGLWELTAATASGNAKQVTLTPLVGSWTGSFQEQSSTDAKCFGAKAAGLRIDIAQAASNHISGTLWGLAHYHADLSTDAEQTEGDAQLEGVSFSGTLIQGEDGIAFACTTPQDALGSVELTLVFGTRDDPSAATATLTTRHTYTATFLFVPYDREAMFSDTFVLTRG